MSLNNCSVSLEHFLEHFAEPFPPPIMNAVSLQHRVITVCLLAVCASGFAVWLQSCQSSARFTSANTNTISKEVSNETSKTASAKKPTARTAPTVPTTRPNITFTLTPAQDKMLDVAYSWVSVPYRYGNSSRAGTDCSGFTMRVYEEVGIFLPRSAREQYGLGRFVTTNELEPGDLIFFNTMGSGVSHVGLYVGDNTMIHASTKLGVTTQPVFDAYYVKTFVGAKRLL